jgi:hypothetical protein
MVILLSNYQNYLKERSIVIEEEDTTVANLLLEVDDSEEKEVVNEVEDEDSEDESLFTFISGPNPVYVIVTLMLTAQGFCLVIPTTEIGHNHKQTH